MLAIYAKFQREHIWVFNLGNVAEGTWRFRQPKIGVCHARGLIRPVNCTDRQNLPRGRPFLVILLLQPDGYITKNKKIFVIKDDALTPSEPETFARELGWECVGPVKKNKKGLRRAKTADIDCATINLIVH